MVAAWDNDEATTLESSSSDLEKEQESLDLMVGLDEVHSDPFFYSCTDLGLMDVEKRPRRRGSRGKKEFLELLPRSSSSSPRRGNRVKVGILTSKNPKLSSVDCSMHQEQNSQIS
ncbi:hypothetical protein Taro_030618 [Colocasia esculenta]|uniref:Uncharacterized protein n=1 Tax=Colocasia esculenta TaxID=4460 RepID=A0A843VSD6_COLES|nr:hypothetical protein [Colocasia esculenta]